MALLKNIILDLGGVLLDIDYQKTKMAFENLGFDAFEQMYSQYSADAVFAQLETGTISNGMFYGIMMERSGGRIPQQAIRDAWNAMLLDFRPDSLAFLETLASKYSLYLLSNTNAIHLEAFQQIFTAQTQKSSLDDYFSKAYYSHEVGLRKPNTDIFEFVLTDAGIKASESLFVDDSYNNIETANRLGFLTHLLLPGQKVENLEGYW